MPNNKKEWGTKRGRIPKACVKCRIAKSKCVYRAEGMRCEKCISRDYVCLSLLPGQCFGEALEVYRHLESNKNEFRVVIPNQNIVNIAAPATESANNINYATLTSASNTHNDEQIGYEPQNYEAIYTTSQDQTQEYKPESNHYGECLPEEDSREPEFTPTLFGSYLRSDENSISSETQSQHRKLKPREWEFNSDIYNEDLYDDYPHSFSKLYLPTRDDNHSLKRVIVDSFKGAKISKGVKKKPRRDNESLESSQMQEPINSSITDSIIQPVLSLDNIEKQKSIKKKDHSDSPTPK